jgi:hypothetical protein
MCDTSAAVRLRGARSPWPGEACGAGAWGLKGLPPLPLRSGVPARFRSPRLVVPPAPDSPARDWACFFSAPFGPGKGRKKNDHALRGNTAPKIMRDRGGVRRVSPSRATGFYFSPGRAAEGFGPALALKLASGPRTAHSSKKGLRLTRPGPPAAGRHARATPLSRPLRPRDPGAQGAHPGEKKTPVSQRQQKVAVEDGLNRTTLPRPFLHHLWGVVKNRSSSRVDFFTGETSKRAVHVKRIHHAPRDCALD